MLPSKGTTERRAVFYLLNEREVLTHPGKVSRGEARELAEQEFEQFAARRRSALEVQGEADLLKLVEAKLKKLPKSKAPKPGAR